MSLFWVWCFAVVAYFGLLYVVDCVLVYLCLVLGLYCVGGLGV